MWQLAKLQTKGVSVVDLWQCHELSPWEREAISINEFGCTVKCLKAWPHSETAYRPALHAERCWHHHGFDKVSCLADSHPLWNTTQINTREPKSPLNIRHANIRFASVKQGAGCRLLVSSLWKQELGATVAGSDLHCDTRCKWHASSHSSVRAVTYYNVLHVGSITFPLWNTVCQ